MSAWDKYPLLLRSPVRDRCYPEVTLTRFILSLAIAVAIIAPAATAFAQPSPGDLDKAKKEFIAGKKAFDGGDFAEAASHFKTSYNLSKKPTLLYNVGLANESGGQDDIALFYYRKYLADAQADDAQRADVTERVKALEKKFGGGNTAVTPPNNTTVTPPTVTPPAETHKEPKAIKPAGTYTAADFQHQVVDSAPPKKPLDVTAFVPEDSGFEVTLFYRTAGEGKFQGKVMRWRYKELVARIPPDKMLGESIQYYIEVKDQAKAVVTRSAKSTSPNLVTLEAGAPERFYPDWNDKEGTPATAAEVKASDEDEDPLNRNKKRKVIAQPNGPDGSGIEIQPQPTGPGRGFRDVGSGKFNGMKWGATGAAALGVGLGVVFYLQAAKQARALETDSQMCGAPPCRSYDPYDADLQAAGQRYETLMTVSLVVGVAAAGVAGYYWYKTLTAQKHGDYTSASKAKPDGATPGAPPVAAPAGEDEPPPRSSWIITPSIGEGFAGAAAVGTF